MIGNRSNMMTGSSSLGSALIAAHALVVIAAIGKKINPL
jgi:hypothetical protein